jgi:hypothetical protein
MSPDSFESIGKGLYRQLQRKGLSQAAEAAYVCAMANQLAAGRFEAVRWQAGRLTIVAPNSLVAHELGFAKLDLIKDLKAKLHWTESTPLSISIRVRP